MSKLCSLLCVYSAWSRLRTKAWRLIVKTDRCVLLPPVTLLLSPSLSQPNLVFFFLSLSPYHSLCSTATVPVYVCVCVCECDLQLVVPVRVIVHGREALLERGRAPRQELQESIRPPSNAPNEVELDRAVLSTAELGTSGIFSFFQ